jgi:ElaB/YqjD/DUF883 family membrane-anchored ribosome-binding protein
MSTPPQSTEREHTHRSEELTDAPFDVPIQPSTEDNTDAPNEAADKAAALASDTREAATALASDVKGAATGLGRAAKDQASDFAAGVGEELSRTAEEQKARGVETLHSYMRAIASAAQELEAQSPRVAQSVRSAAERIGTLSDTISNRNVHDLVKAANDMARTQPLVFIGGAALAGFALSRFLKSSAEKAQG